MQSRIYLSIYGSDKMGSNRLEVWVMEYPTLQCIGGVLRYAILHGIVLVDSAVNILQRVFVYRLVCLDTKSAGDPKVVRVRLFVADASN